MVRIVVFAIQMKAENIEQSTWNPEMAPHAASHETNTGQSLDSTPILLTWSYSNNYASI